MRKVVCAGIIPLQKMEEHWQVLLIRHKLGGHWGFPKGHVEFDETLRTTAAREMKEECNLEVASYFDFPGITDKYQFFIGKTKVHKTVTYFLAEVKGQAKVCEPDEITDFSWMMLPKASEYVTFDGLKQICLQTEGLVKDL